MWLEGSCHCGSVHFRVRSPHPVPFCLCYCGICRKTAGGGGYAINLGAEHSFLQVEGGENVTMYHAVLRDEDGTITATSQGQRHFCKVCGSALWAWDPRWPELVHPFASAIDTELPEAPEHTHIMLGSKAGWVPLHAGPGDKSFAEYPVESLAQWHQRLKLESAG